MPSNPNSVKVWYFEYLALQSGECVGDLLPSLAGVDVNTVVRVVV
jgi:hypothetical protein